MKLTAAIVGATGYTGLELVRILSKHPQVEISAVTSEKLAGKVFAEVFPALSHCTLQLESFDAKKIAAKAEFAFLCLPHHEAMQAAAELLKLGLKVIDLSADFRLHEQKTYEAWYGPHSAPKLLSEAVYGLPELHREKIIKAKLVANPGCYPTSCILGLAPLLKLKWIELDSITCDAKSGASGAGRSASTELLFSEIQENFKAYKVGQHRHTPEIEQELSLLASQEIKIVFTPHLLPIDRGILSTIYAKPKVAGDSAKLQQIYTDFYAKEPFVKISPLGSFPATKDVRLSNACHIGVHWDARTNKILIISVIDNLCKGASGQAIQNMNLMMGYAETTGLS